MKLPIDTGNVFATAQAARIRWRIENEVFNTLKNYGYELEHNYGHGQQYLSSTLAGLMLLAFLSDQLQSHACSLYKAARAYAATQKSMWELISREFLWLRRRDLQSLTDPGVHPETPACAPLKHTGQEKPDGGIYLKALEMGVQLSCCIHSEIPKKSAIY